VFDFEELDHYELLGVPRGASSDEIKRAYRREISKYHPDRFAGADAAQQEYAQRRSQAITAAYTTLSDFGARSAYNLGRTPSRPVEAPRRGVSTGATTTARDHQAELYDQARAHLDAGRTVQALGVLRQLQQINPFYRDSADLLLRAEAAVRVRQEPGTGASLRRLFLAGTVFGAALLALLFWGFGARTVPTGAAPVPTQNPPGQSAVVATPPPAPSAPSLAPTAAPSLEPTAATSAPSPEPASAPSPEPTLPPSPEPTAVPTPLPTLANAAPTVAPLEQQGQALLADDFSRGGWASMSGRGWSVGYAQERYRISVDAGIGTIWSFRSVTAADVTVLADVQVLSGAGGLVLRFQDEYNYLTLVVEPQQSAYKLEQRSRGVITVLAAGISDAIQPGDTAQNRVAARISGNLVQVVINGQLLAEVEASGATDSPRFGLVAISGAVPAEALFDNFQVRSVE
jgi:hypothetical protein